MSNVQQPEMRRSGLDPLVQDSRKTATDTSPRAPSGGGEHRKVPKDQQSPYGPSDNEEEDQD